jgi:hypothetical protein
MNTGTKLNVSTKMVDLSLQTVGVGVQNNFAVGNVGRREREAGHTHGVRTAVVDVEEA